MPAKIFISYSSKDGKLLSECREHLKHLQRNRLTELFADVEIKAGEKWLPRIKEAAESADIVILLVTQHFIGSDFIYKEEMPRFLGRAAGGEATILPVFLAPFDRRENYPFKDPDGREQSITLVDIQGINDPRNLKGPLSEDQRALTWQVLIDRVRELTAKTPAAHAAIKMEPGETCSGRGVNPNREYNLVINLKRSGNDLQLNYHLPDLPSFANRTLSWKKYERRLQDIADSLDGDGRIRLEKRFRDNDFGDTLFEILFGEQQDGVQQDYEPILRQIYNMQDELPVSPVSAPITIRIVTEDPLLAGLPWRLTRWRGRNLVGEKYRFLVSSELHPTARAEVRLPDKIVIIAPKQESGAHTHGRIIADLIRQIWPDGPRSDIRRACTPAKTKRCLLGARPALVYIRAPRAIRDNESGLLLDKDEQGDFLSFSQLAKLLEQAGTSLVYLNIDGAARFDHQTPGQILGKVVPLVLWRRFSDHHCDADTVAVTWLRTWLNNGGDPSDIIHNLTRNDPKPERAGLCIHTAYRSWHTSMLRRDIRARAEVRLRLDRDTQKALAAKHLKEFVRSDTRRVMAMMAYAVEGNMVHAHNEQLLHYLEDDLENTAEMVWRDLDFPDGSDLKVLERQLEDTLRNRLDADMDEPTKHLLQRQFSFMTPGKKPLLWLNWGVFGGSSPPLKPAEIEVWLRFCASRLVMVCPDNVRIVSFLALEVRNKKALKRLTDDTRQFGAKAWCRKPSFDFNPLKPLAVVDESELYRFLDDSGNTDCQPTEVNEAVSLLMERTGGVFEQLVPLIQEAEDGSWENLLFKLRLDLGHKPSDDLSDEPY